MFIMHGALNVKMVVPTLAVSPQAPHEGVCGSGGDAVRDVIQVDTTF